MAQAQLDQAIAEKESEAALAYQSNLLFQNMNHFVQKDQDFFLGDNVDQNQQKRKIITTKQSSFLRKRNSRKLYIATKIKSRNFLTNISYSRLKQKDYDNQSFVIDSFSYLLLHFNPMKLEKEFVENDNKDYINMIWVKCMPKELLDFISQEYYFKLLYNLEFQYATANDIIKQFPLANPNHMNLLIQYFKQYALKYQYMYSNLSPKHFWRVDNYGLKCKSKLIAHLKNGNHPKKQHLISTFQNSNLFKKKLQS